jgi:predicted PhzF superfamily epimerase YddE/YHI9
MEVPFYQVDAFTSRLFGGNPAAVCPLHTWLPDSVLQAIALENNLSETAFFVPDGDGFHLRWFTPAAEVDLCGHATLASAYVISNYIQPSLRNIRFRTLSGNLFVSTDADRFTLDFPERAPVRVDAPRDLVEALGKEPREVWCARDYLAVYDSEADVRAVEPDMGKLVKVDKFATIITAPGEGCDFVSRFFAPAKGVPEDPVTGSSHCTLTPYWSQRLGKKKLEARQVSARGGELMCELIDGRVKMSGAAVLYATGTIQTA